MTLINQDAGAFKAELPPTIHFFNLKLSTVMGSYAEHCNTLWQRHLESNLLPHCTVHHGVLPPSPDLSSRFQLYSHLVGKATMISLSRMRTGVASSRHREVMYLYTELH